MTQEDEELLATALRALMICGYNEGTIFQNEWPSYGISDEAGRRLLSALDKAETTWKIEDENPKTP